MLLPTTLSAAARPKAFDTIVFLRPPSQAASTSHKPSLSPLWNKKDANPCRSNTPTTLPPSQMPENPSVIASAVADSQHEHVMYLHEKLSFPPLAESVPVFPLSSYSFQSHFPPQCRYSLPPPPQRKYLLTPRFSHMILIHVLLTIAAYSTSLSRSLYPQSPAFKCKRFCLISERYVTPSFRSCFDTLWQE